MTGQIFINYRRDDTGEAAQALYTQLGQNFSIAKLYMDFGSLEPGSIWPDRIRGALAASDAMLCLIGESWLTLDDEYGRRRIDARDDWVRLEIEQALEQGIKIYPILLGRARMPAAEALPESIAELSGRQSWRLTRDNWLGDLRVLVSQLEQDNILEARHSGLDHPAYPHPDKAKLPALTEEELGEALASLPDWEPWTERILREYPYERRELRRSVSFRGFRTAIQFMAEASDIFARLRHHPRWGNEWQQVSIRLTTWDAGNKITAADVNAAREVEKLIGKFRAAGKVVG
ncbi:MAG TPA: 4a-hydroxytetrahydrobiopterin dehydratase [Allosphingosinicella sp.]|nr:4a-hydroxytetrahydrobiopterin dehydratase [Allosphingosinicella sp.]